MVEQPKTIWGEQGEHYYVRSDIVEEVRTALKELLPLIRWTEDEHGPTYLDAKGNARDALNKLEELRMPNVSESMLQSILENS